MARNTPAPHQCAHRPPSSRNAAPQVDERTPAGYRDGTLNEMELGLSQTLGTLAESSAVLAAFVGLVGICRFQVLLDRRRDAEGELRAWMRRLTKQDTFVRPLEAVLAMVEEERTRVEGCQQKDFLEAALAADRRRRALQPVLRCARATLLVLEATTLTVLGACTAGLANIETLTGASWMRPAIWVAILSQVVVPIWCVWLWTEEATLRESPQ